MITILLFCLNDLTNILIEKKSIFLKCIESIIEAMWSSQKKNIQMQNQIRIYIFEWGLMIETKEITGRFCLGPSTKAKKKK